MAERDAVVHGKQHPAPDAVPALAELQMAHVRAVLGLAKKVVVCDLDNTLWGGVIGEDGLTGIALGPGSPAGEAYAALQEYLLELKGAACCSRSVPRTIRKMRDCRSPTIRIHAWA